MALGRSFRPCRNYKNPTHPPGIGTWKLFPPSRKLHAPPAPNLHLGDFSALAEITNPTRPEFGTWKIFPPSRKLQTTPALNLHLEDFSAITEIANPTRPEFALGRFLRPRRNYTWKIFRTLAEITNPKTPPGWNCTWKIFRPWARVTNPTARMELHLEDHTRLEFALGRFFHHRGNCKPHPPGPWRLGDFFALAENYTCKIFHPCSRKLQTQTPPGWNCTWKIFRPWARITNLTARMELHLEDFSARNLHSADFCAIAGIANPTRPDPGTWEIFPPWQKLHL